MIRFRETIELDTANGTITKEQGETLEGDIFYKSGNEADIQLVDGSMLLGVPVDCFEEM